MQTALQTLCYAGGAVGMWFTGRCEGRLFRASRPPYLSRKDEEAILAAVARALHADDMQYLVRQPFDTRDLRRFARSSRKRFVRLYLDQCRVSFQAGAKVAREFAADSDAPELAFAVLKQSIRFHCIWAALRLSLTLRLVGPTWRLAETLIRAADLSSAPRPNAHEARGRTR